MGNLSSLPPEYLIVICEFTYAPRGKTKYLPNEVRRFLVGMMQQTGEDRRPGIPEKIAQRFGSEVIVPLYFSLIKHTLSKSEEGD